MAFTLLLSFLVALPSFGIDMSLPALTAMGAALHVAPAQAGLMMSLFMLGFAVAPLFYGPASDRYGRKPVVVFACMLFIIAGIGCAFARSLPTLLTWRVVQGAGAGASTTIALAIIRDLFEGQAARTRLSYVTIATMVVPMIAPSAGVALLALGGWRAIHAGVVSGLVATLNDEHSAFSMTALMAACSLLGLVSYLLIARPAERVVIPS
jgi:DHA1 family bicyclomycin/chloramphenicol resistance-like MFS transporter